jgi:hypothetical protein
LYEQYTYGDEEQGITGYVTLYIEYLKARFGVYTIVDVPLSNIIIDYVINIEENTNTGG